MAFELSNMTVVVLGCTAKLQRAHRYVSQDTGKSHSYFIHMLLLEQDVVVGWWHWLVEF